MATKAQGSTLLKLARSAIEEAFRHKTVSVPSGIRKQPLLQQPKGVFVTILKNGELRGSMGYTQGTYPLVDGVVMAARDAAFKDPRFKSVTKKELLQLRIRIDILSKFKPTKISGIKPRKHGIFIEYGLFRALQLPEDARKYKWTAAETVQNALRKAGLAPELWNNKNIRIYKFTVQRLEEKIMHAAAGI